MTSARSMDNPADLINVAIEHLVKERIELPSFNEVDRLCGHCRAFANQSIFAAIAIRLSKNQKKSLKALLVREDSEIFSRWNSVKEGPANSTLNHLKDAIDKLTWLKSLGDFSFCLDGVPEIKVRHFASIGRMTDARNVRLLGENRRLAVVVCTIHRMQVKAHDDLVTMFIKRVKKFHSSAKNKLEAHRTETLANTRNLLNTLSEIIAASSGDKTSLTAIGQAVKAKIDSHGGSERLLEQCDNAIMVNTNNHLPFVHEFFKSHRQFFIEWSKHCRSAKQALTINFSSRLSLLCVQKTVKRR